MTATLLHVNPIAGRARRTPQIILGSFLLLNLVLAVIYLQFSKDREDSEEQQEQAADQQQLNGDAASVVTSDGLATSAPPTPLGLPKASASPYAIEITASVGSCTAADTAVKVVPAVPAGGCSPRGLAGRVRGVCRAVSTSRWLDLLGLVVICASAVVLALEWWVPYRAALYCLVRILAGAG